MPRERLPIGAMGKITVTHLQPGQWQARAWIRDKDGVRRRIAAHGATSGKAQTALKAKAATRVPPSAGALKATTTLTTASRMWLEHLDVKHATRAGYEKTVRVHIVPLIGALTVGEVKTSQVRAFLQTVAEPREQDGETVGGPTAAKHAKVALSQILGMCVSDDVIPHNPVGAAALPRGKRAAVVALSPSDVQAVRDTVVAWGKVKAPGPPRNAPLLLDVFDVLAGTGCRPGEVLALRWEDVDLRAGVVRITGTITRTKDGLIRQETPKTETSTRGVTVPAFVVQVLRLRYLRAEDKTGGVFTTRNGTYYELSNIHRLWRQARGERWEHVSFKHYRQAVATLISRAEGAEAAAGQLGHAGPEVTRRYYIERDGLVDFSAVVEAFAPPA
ncbi:site-specific integrase [Kocuria sp.]|uniref:tyrosine-type recombinase/integrase n=1 Tax=Kocuria sp. TaxID=1871328 RepID=UPI0026DBFE5F|nr:site-specific integrase [Kocuria sp.]MDO4919894.1 site-specific integrase [Kocuria sp.]